MCSRMWDKPAPRCASSSMLPVAHHACTLATGALRSSWTMIVSPFGSIHFCTELDGSVIADESSIAAAFRLAVLNIIATKSAMLGANRIIQTLIPVIPKEASQLALLPAQTALQKPLQNHRRS